MIIIIIIIIIIKCQLQRLRSYGQLIPEQVYKTCVGRNSDLGNNKGGKCAKPQLKHSPEAHPVPSELLGDSLGQRVAHVVTPPPCISYAKVPN